jgi:hypothetical protein
MTELKIFSKEKNNNNNNNTEKEEDIIKKKICNTLVHIDEEYWEEGQFKRRENKKSITEKTEKDNTSNITENRSKKKYYESGEQLIAILKPKTEHIPSDYSKYKNPLEKDCIRRNKLLLPVLIILAVLVVLIIFLSVKYLNFNNIYNMEKDNIKEYCQVLDLEHYNCQFTVHLKISICNTTCSCINQKGLEECFDVPKFTMATAYVLGFFLIIMCMLICLLWALKIRYCPNLNSDLDIYAPLNIL